LFKFIYISDAGTSVNSFAKNLRKFENSYFETDLGFKNSPFYSWAQPWYTFYINLS
jgi:hypothetical protein